MIKYITNVHFQSIIVLLLSFSLCVSCGEDPQSQNDIIITDPPEPILVKDYMATWSETNNLIAYIHAHIRQMGDIDSSGIYIIKPDGTDRQFFYRKDFITGLDWSPDGNWLIFSINDGLFKISYPDKVIDTLRGPGQYYSLTWSPDGQKIASAIRAGNNGIYIINIDGSNYHMIIPYSKRPYWIYEDSILYVNFESELPVSAICMADTGGINKRVIYDHNEKFVGEINPKMNNNTRRIVFKASIPGEKAGIWKLESSEDEPVLLHELGKYPEFSPDGGRVIFTYIHLDYGNICMINWDGTGFRSVTEPIEGG